MVVLSVILRLIVALGLLNVWLVRQSKSTDYRGADSQNLKQEFLAYGLPLGVFYLVGFLKVGSAIALLASLWLPSIAIYPAGVVAFLMVGALLMHVKVKDPLLKSLPAALMLAMSLSIVALSLPSGY